MDFKIGTKPLSAALAASALLGGLAIPSDAQTNRDAAYVPSQTSRTKVVPGTFIFTGPVARTFASSDRSITVDHNGILRPAVVPESAVVTRDGSRISIRDLRRGDTVRVTAVQVAPNRWRASRINMVEPVVVARGIPSSVVDRSDRVVDRTDREARVIRRERLGGADPVVEASSIYSGVGVVESVNGDDGIIKVRVGQNTRQVFAEFAQISGVSRVRDLRKGDRVRVEGELFGRDVFADRVSMLD